MYLCLRKKRPEALFRQSDTDSLRPAAEPRGDENRVPAQSGRLPLRRPDVAACPGRRAPRAARGGDQLPDARRREPHDDHACPDLLARSGSLGSAGHHLPGRRLPDDDVAPAAGEQHRRRSLPGGSDLCAALRQRRLRGLRRGGLPRNAARRGLLSDLYGRLGQRRGGTHAPHGGLAPFRGLRAGAAAPQQGLHALRCEDRRPILYAAPSEQSRDRRQLHLDRPESRPAPLGQPPLRGPHASGTVGQRPHRRGVCADPYRPRLADDLPRGRRGAPLLPGCDAARRGGPLEGACAQRAADYGARGALRAGGLLRQRRLLERPDCRWRPHHALLRRRGRGDRPGELLGARDPAAAGKKRKNHKNPT